MGKKSRRKRTGWQNKAWSKRFPHWVKRFARALIMRWCEATRLQVKPSPPARIALDLALGVGGIPRGRNTEIYGRNRAGKTTLCQHIIAEAQKNGGTCAFIDMNTRSIPPTRRAVGVNIDDSDTSPSPTRASSARHRRSPDPLRRAGRPGRGLGRRARPARRDRRRDGRQPHGLAGALLMSRRCASYRGRSSNPTPARIFYQPIAHEDRRHVWNRETTTGGNAL